jgi:GntR family transcriptional regulator/MocR family aminotransferase
MAKSSSVLPVWIPALDRRSAAPLHRQLYVALREAVLHGRIAPGMRLPSTRDLARELSVSRNTVVNAFEQLLAEGYLSGRVGSGTYVSEALGRKTESGHATSTATGKPRLSKRGVSQESAHRAMRHLPSLSLSLSKRGARLAPARVLELTGAASPAPFIVGVPALDRFSYKTWGRLLARRWREQDPALLSYADPAGYRPLREAVANYLQLVRAVRCEPDQVILVSGSQQGLDLSARLLLDPGDAVWFEEPGYVGARAAFNSAGARLVPVPVDEEGMDVERGERLCARARLAYLSPSHQYPLGVTMSLERRFRLLEWAERSGAWILEDDYDSEFRYRGRPLASLQGLDPGGRVIYLGTFSKVLFPSLRLGYLVVPRRLADSFAVGRALTDRQSPMLEQAVLADFITQGHFARHIRSMRLLYAERQAALVRAAEELEGRLEVRPADAGMHLVGWLPPGANDRAASRAAASRGVLVSPLSHYYLSQNPHRPGLLLGYAAIPSTAMRRGMRELALALGRPR